MEWNGMKTVNYQKHFLGYVHKVENPRKHIQTDRQTDRERKGKGRRAGQIVKRVHIYMNRGDGVEVMYSCGHVYRERERN